MRSYPFAGDELVYCDPPYMHETRGRAGLYRFELDDRQHAALLDTIAVDHRIGVADAGAIDALRYPVAVHQSKDLH